MRGCVQRRVALFNFELQCGLQEDLDAKGPGCLATKTLQGIKVLVLELLRARTARASGSQDIPGT